MLEFPQSGSGAGELRIRYDGGHRNDAVDILEVRGNKMTSRRIT